jgi:3-deoxy-D-manno-octulosonic-acid transferase
MLLYRVLLGLSLGLYMPYALLRQAAGGKRIGDWRGRLSGNSLPRLSHSLWIHGVSVGEVSAARAVLKAVARLDPELPRVLSSSTAAGQELARRCPEADFAVPFPVDLKVPVERALAALDPSLVLLTETEIWPLFLERSAQKNVPVAIVNGRISDRSYRRYRFARTFLGKAISRISLFVMQTEIDAGRVAELGAPRERIRVAGNVKFDRIPVRDAELEALLRGWAGTRKILIAGSTHEAEEELVLDAWEGLQPRPFLLVAPRRPERFAGVFSLLQKRGIRAARRSEGAPAADAAVLDTVGELASAYAVADVAIVGGTLCPVGGHNPIEAWTHGVPTLLGPNVQNIRDVASEGLRCGAAVSVSGQQGLARAAAGLLADEGERARRGASARALVEKNRGAAERTAAAVLPLRKTA